MSTYLAYLTLKRTLRFPKVRVLPAQDKHIQLSSFAELWNYPLKSLVEANLPEYVDTHSLLTGYLSPCQLDTRWTFNIRVWNLLADFGERAKEAWKWAPFIRATWNGKATTAQFNWLSRLCKTWSNFPPPKHYDQQSTIPTSSLTKFSKHPRDTQRNLHRDFAL